ncbi:MAG TPA: chemotaxis-specific protein-glutamate methyltransferase CheB [Devosia sp.]|nr:chemotaxis-specific protein-glutamate methyltransferase CheB [Devosia sp.]
MARIRVLAAEDSPTVRDLLVSVLQSDPEIELVGVASDGKEAIELCAAHRPDVVTMDMMMPVMSGLAATEHIMAYSPTPILVVSSSFNRGELFKMYDALVAGAVDVLEKPSGREPEGEWERKFLSTVKLVSRIKVITHLKARSRPAATAATTGSIRPSSSRVSLAAIGASTGGPGAIVEVLRGLPADLGVPVLFVLHINPQFGHAFADWLDAQTAWRARFAIEGEPLSAATGQVVMAPPGRHLMLKDGRLRLDDGPERFSCKPSVDVLFESVAAASGGSTVAALLTGMGRDGAQGLLAIRQAGGNTIAQDEASSVVYGMPREAVLNGGAGRVLPLGEIASAITAAVRGARA